MSRSGLIAVALFLGCDNSTKSTDTGPDTVDETIPETDADQDGSPEGEDLCEDEKGDRSTAGGGKTPPQTRHLTTSAPTRHPLFALSARLTSQALRRPHQAQTSSAQAMSGPFPCPA